MLCIVFLRLNGWRSQNGMYFFVSLQLLNFEQVGHRCVVVATVAIFFIQHQNTKTVVLHNNHKLLFEEGACIKRENMINSFRCQDRNFQFIGTYRSNNTKKFLSLIFVSSNYKIAHR